MPPPRGAPSDPEGASAGGAWALSAVTTSDDRTRELAASLSRLTRPGDVIVLTGGLGAGKTTFAQGFARGLGVVGPVTSPTFTLVRQYSCPGVVRQLVHADLYRLESLAEVADLALLELAEPGPSHGGAVVLVEWGEAAAPLLGDEVLVVRLDAGPGGRDDDRTVHLCGRGRRWSGRQADMAAALSAYGAEAE